MKIFKYYTKSLFLSSELIFWSIVFVVFWLFMGAYLFTRGIPKEAIALYEFKIGYTSSWYGVAGTFSLASLCVGLCYYFLFTTSSLPYVTKYGKVSLSSFFLQIISGTFIYSSLLAIILMLCTYGIFSHALSYNLLPANPWFALLVIGIGGLFYYLLAVVIILILILLRKIKSVRLVSFLPMMISYALVFLQVFGVANEILVYASPFNNIYSLAAYTYFGKPIPLEWENTTEKSVLINPTYCILILLAWMIILTMANICLMRGVKEIPTEELREL
jgi:hypothetical protein